MSFTYLGTFLLSLLVICAPEMLAVATVWFVIAVPLVAACCCCCCCCNSFFFARASFFIRVLLEMVDEEAEGVEEDILEDFLVGGILLEPPLDHFISHNVDSGESLRRDDDFLCRVRCSLLRSMSSIYYILASSPFRLCIAYTAQWGGGGGL